MKIRQFQQTDKAEVIQLWHDCGLTRPWNNPSLDIERKLQVQPELFFVGYIETGDIVATAMSGYDGHRGWVYYLAVHPDQQGKSYGKVMMQHVEEKLIARGCPKINLQIRSDNEKTINFYHSLGYKDDGVFSMGKRLISDN